MPTIITHALIPLATGLALNQGLGERAAPRVSARLLLCISLCAMLPDMDTIGLQFGVPYASVWGHRGFTHSITFALITALCLMLFAQKLRATATITFLLVFTATLSHPLFDMLTNGGKGIALFWPLSDARLFFPSRPIQVSHIGLRFFDHSAWATIKSEFIWVTMPAIVWFLMLSLIMRMRANKLGAHQKYD